MKWQCVEYARRYWVQRYNAIIPPVSWACYLWNMTHVARRVDYHQIPVTKHPTGGTEPPQEGDLLIYASTPNQMVGHVAVVLHVVTLGEGQMVIRVGEQNQDNDVMWKGGTYADELPIELGVDEEGKTTYTIRHYDPDLEMLGWVRVHPESASPRPVWTPPDEPTLPIDGIYGEESVKALQRLLGSYADGFHGGMTNTNIRNLVKEIGAPEDAPPTLSGQDLLLSFKKFFIHHWLLVSHPDWVGPVPTESENKICSEIQPESLLMNCQRTNCICRAMVPLAEGEALDTSDELLTVGPCPTTQCLQVFLNNIQHPHDIPNAIQQLAQQTEGR
jgi:hypothetical protein